jgi:hypothetical protein
MSYSATIKLAPVWTFERHTDPRWNRPGRALYEPGSLRFLPGRTEVPLLVDHNEDRQIGTVRELFRMDWIDGPWICAHAVLDEPPVWMKQHETKASFSHRNLHVRPYSEGDLIASAFVDEVSVLLRQTPREPLAALLLARR